MYYKYTMLSKALSSKLVKKPSNVTCYVLIATSENEAINTRL